MAAQGPPPSPTPATASPQQEPISPKRKKILEDLNKLTTEELIALNAHTEWVGKRHKHQAPPPGKWTIWLMLAGRGAGKTRAAAEWLWFQAYQKPESRWLVSAPTSADVRDTCFEGDSGLMSVIPERVVKEYNRSLSEIVLKNGSLIKGISAETPDRLRGGQWHGAWCHPAGTPVLMADGSEKPIEQIQVGDVVQTRFGPHSVTAAGLSGNTADWITITYGNGHTLTATADHPVLLNGTFKPIVEAKIGDEVTTLKGSAKIIQWVKTPAYEQVYNLTVDAVNEYVAGGVVVHNCDELAAWQYDQEAWDMIMFALRLGKHPRIVATTTPKPKALIRELIERDGDDVAVVRASTYENIANLAPTFQQQLLKFEGTTLGRQEIHAEVLNPEEQGIIKRNWIKLWPAKKPLPVFEHIVMSMDTAFTEQTRDKKTSDADPSACVVLGLFYNEDKPNIMLLDCWEDRLGMPDLIKRVHKEREVYYGDDSQRPLIKPMIGPSRQLGTGRKPDTIVIEDKGSGISLRQMLARENILAHAYNPGKASKLTRLHMVSHLFAGGMVWFVESEKRKGQIRSWAEPLLYQLCAFSGEGSIRHDDLMDACTQGLRFLADKDMISVSKPKPLQPRLIVNSRPRMNPYGV